MSNESWNAIGFEAKLPYSFKLGLEQNLRFVDQSPRFKQTFTELSLSYTLIDGLVIMIPLRYAVFDDKTKQRLSFAGSYKYDLKPIRFKYRLKFQRIYEDGIFTDDVARNKLSIRYRLNKRIRPFISGETFLFKNLNKYQFDEYRFSFGIKVDFLEKRSINIFYIRKVEDINKSNPDQINVFGLAYDYTIN